MTTKRTDSEKLAFAAEDLIRTGEYGMKNFNENFARDPAHAFEWSGSAFDAAAKMFVGKTIKAWLEGMHPDVTVDERAATIVREIRSNVMRLARYPEHSTSVQSNAMSLCRMAVWAELLEKMEGKF